jgi:hypothetical protein
MGIAGLHNEARATETTSKKMIASWNLWCGQRKKRCMATFIKDSRDIIHSFPDIFSPKRTKQLPIDKVYNYE